MSTEVGSPDVEHELAEAVDHRRRLVEAGGAVDHPERLHPAGDAVEVAELGPKRGDDREPGEPGRLRRVLDGDLAADLAGGQRPVAVDRAVAGDVGDCAADPHEVELEL